MEWIESKKDSRQIKNCILVECVAEIRNNKTGEVRNYQTDEVLEDGNDSPNVFNWKEHNFSCDCNRYLFFKESNGECMPDDEFNNLECSNGKFSVNLKNKKTGNVYYREYNT